MHNIPVLIAFARLIADRGATEQERVVLRTLHIVRTALIGLLLVPAGASAHAVLMASTPAAGASVTAGKLSMSFRYNSRIDRVRSRLTLTLPDRTQSILRILPTGGPDTLETGADLTTPGAYVMHWQVLATDGHITRGDVPFTVTGP
jgi:methionine-rich copper-binding protein CopC